jgi:hypothetical protein
VVSKKQLCKSKYLDFEFFEKINLLLQSLNSKGVMYIPSENKFGQCTRHKHKLVCMLDAVPRHGFDEIPENESKDRLDQYRYLHWFLFLLFFCRNLRNLRRYECCYATYDPQKRNGCVLDSHRKAETDFDDI